MIYKQLGVDTNYAKEISVYAKNIAGYRARNGNPPLSLLEIGSGTGRISRALASIDGVQSFTGIDTHQGNLDHAKSSCPHLDFRLQNFLTLPMCFTYGAVAAPYTLGNMFDFVRQEVFIRKSIAQGGLAMIDTILPDTYGVYEDTIRHVGTCEFLGFNYEVVAHYFCRKSLERIARSAGCRLQTFTDYEFCRKGENAAVHTIVSYER